MSRRDTEKDYLALVYGRVRPASIDIALRLRRDSGIDAEWSRQLRVAHPA
jgi:hypothetical protein